MLRAVRYCEPHQSDALLHVATRCDSISGVNFEIAWCHIFSARDNPGAIPPVTQSHYSFNNYYYYYYYYYYYFIIIIIIAYSTGIGVIQQNSKVKQKSSVLRVC